ncbi:BnaC01g30010D [Brassica napus]|uniref:BnaC01g30010D protein n=1 Tax=Brassica napus TaxID=3708 RepID=A0A078GJH0_BRANA|nr:BnaC01g30010D [Brassica napus]
MVDSLGFTTKLAESTWRKVSSDSESKGNPDSVLNLLKIFTLERSFNLELTAILSKVPKILRIKKDKAFSIYYDFAKEVIEADKSLKKLPPQSCLREGSRQENKLRNILVFLKRLFLAWLLRLTFF